jgi:hypothetical protein
MNRESRFAKLLIFLLAAIFFVSAPITAFADAAAEMQKKLQNPLGNIKAVMTDNVIGFDTGTTGDTSYGFSLQGVYAMDMPDRGLTFLPRAVVPILGLEPGADVPPIGKPDPNATKSAWGIGDTMIQGFIAPYTSSKWKWGVGPQVSIPTATKNQFEGPQWGVGVAGVITGAITEKLSGGAILGNHWGNSGKYNTMTFQPMLFYALPNAQSIAYNAVISADWEANSSNRWTVPIGLSYNKTWDMGGGHGFDFMVGPYYNFARPDGAARWQIRFGLNWLFP